MLICVSINEYVTKKGNTKEVVSLIWYLQLAMHVSIAFIHLFMLICSVIVESLKVDSLQKLCSSLEPILRNVVRKFSSFWY